MVHAFASCLNSAIRSPRSSAYRADVLGYTELLAKPAYEQRRESSRGVALTGTTGAVNKFTFSAHTDGKIYVENRLVGPPHKVSLFVIGAPALAGGAGAGQHAEIASERAQISFRQFVWLWNRCQGQSTPPLHIEIADWLGQRWRAGRPPARVFWCSAAPASPRWSGSSAPGCC